jgi:hypothetical protein
MKLELKSKGFHAEKILIDGKEIKNVTHIEIIADGRKPPKAIIEIVPKDIEVNGEFEVITQAGYPTGKILCNNKTIQFIIKDKGYFEINLIECKVYYYCSDEKFGDDFGSSLDNIIEKYKNTKIDRYLINNIIKEINQKIKLFKCELE